MTHLVWKNLLNINPDDPSLQWQSFREGVDIIPLYQSTQSECSCALLRYQPNASVPEHEHVGMEHLFILKGSQQDEYGVYEAGTFLVNPIDTHHQVSSPEGCVVLAIWEKPVKFLNE